MADKDKVKSKKSSKPPNERSEDLKVQAGLKTKMIKVDYLARVEGEGSLSLKIKDGKVSDVQLKIFEPPRFFEALLRGRAHTETPDIVARICGICPVAYQMSAVQALEAALSISIPHEVSALRRLLYCGEWLESHILHIYMLHAPDFLGYQDAISLAKVAPDVVKRGLAMKKAGNAIVTVLGGREIHPINVKVGGFYKAPETAELKGLLDALKTSRDDAVETAKWVSSFHFPEFSRDYELVSLRHENEYPMYEGRVVSNKGIDIAVADYEKHFEELHVRHSTALHSRVIARGDYLVGPLARINLNFDKLSPLAKQVAADIKFAPPCLNPFQSIIARSLEVIHAFDEAIRIIEGYKQFAKPFVDYKITQEVTGHGCSEAPRGILYHRYTVDKDGNIAFAKIVPPTSQNQHAIELDLGKFAERYIELPKEELTWRCEQAIRNYDPCISCSTHFLKLDVTHEN